MRLSPILNIDSKTRYKLLIDAVEPLDRSGYHFGFVAFICGERQREFLGCGEMFLGHRRSSYLIVTGHIPKTSGHVLQVSNGFGLKVLGRRTIAAYAIAVRAL